MSAGSRPRWLSLVVQKATSTSSFIHLLAFVTYFPSVSPTGSLAPGSGRCGERDGVWQEGQWPQGGTFQAPRFG